MNLLLDTQSFLYWTNQPEKLTAPALNAICSAGNRVSLSLVTAWEMQIKYGIKKLRLNKLPRELFESELIDGTFTFLPITLDHVEALSRLPDIHRDPFDRLLIAQAIHEDLTLITGDNEIAEYPVRVLWN